MPRNQSYNWRSNLEKLACQWLESLENSLLGLADIYTYIKISQTICKHGRKPFSRGIHVQTAPLRSANFAAYSTFAFMSERPEHLDFPTQWAWPLFAVGVTLAASALALEYWFGGSWLFLVLIWMSGIVLAFSKWLHSVAAQAGDEEARAEMRRGEREYLWQAALRWLRARR
jgi:hypothetical protein